MNITGNKMLITGGATGIGFGLTQRFIREGNTVIICGRREAVLQEAADKLPGLITKVCDLAIDTERTELYNWIATNHSDTNVLVNNAGIQQWMNITDEDFFLRARQEISNVSKGSSWRGGRSRIGRPSTRRRLASRIAA